jgi:outer membrane receptor protein involved in Fe transport
MRFERFPIVLALLLTLSFATAPMFGQSLTTGNINGTVLDPSHAVVPNATVSLKSLDNGSVASTTTSSTGAFSFNLLRPGRYEITVKQGGFAEVIETTEVQVGNTSKVDLNLTVSKTSETVEVTGTAPLINTETSINTAFTQAEVAQLPSAGGDITNIADTSPGVIINSMGGYGNFTVNGLPATSNLFTVNGENDMDPYFNINNSGATNLTLGQNEIAEATVITNPYGGQYGQLAGAQVTYVTKSGSNTFHGNAQYWWNGRYVNANDWLNNNAGAPRPFSNANQWAAAVGGPIIKNKTFFFVDYEGMRFILPNSPALDTPTPAFAAAVMQNISNPASPNYQPNEITTYQTMFNLWAGAKGSNLAVPTTPQAGDFCSSLAFPAFVTGFTAGTTPCDQTFRGSTSALGKEYILGFRVDQKLTSRDNMFFRYKLDHGTQPTTLDPINSNFDALSPQPAWDAQAQETHIFGSNSTNAFTATVSHYVAQFAQNAALVASTFPTGVITSGGSVNFTSFNQAYAFPQGRNVTQYQFIDDFSWTHGVHTLKFGANFRRYDVSDHNFFFNTPGTYFGYNNNGLQELANGRSYQFRQSLNESSNVPIALWGLGVYAEDDWKATRNLKLTLALRVEHSSNPVCNTNCLANFKGPWSSLASVQSAAAGNDPGDTIYSADIAYNQHNAFQSIDKLSWSPRLGFSWDALGTGKTVVSGGFGLFYDTTAAGLLDDLLGNPPSAVSLRVRGTAGVGVLPFDNTAAGAPATFAASAAAFNINESYNTIHANLAALGTAFNPPAVTALVGTMHTPQWQEWNLSVQQQLDRTSVLIVSYVGNHGVKIPYTNAWANAWDPYGIYPASVVPFSPYENNYGTVTQVQSGAISNNNGLTFSYRKQFSHWVSAHANYTWAHNMDEVSNGGIFTYGDSLLGQINPTSLRAANYGNSDYDVRHSFNADFVVNPEFHVGGAMKWIANGWQFSGKWFWRSGLPFSVVDNNWNGAVQNGGSTILAQPLIGGTAPGLGNCSGKNATASPGNSSTPACLDPTVFIQSGSASFNGFNAWSAQRRNQYHGTHFFDMDLNLFKNFKFTERLNFAVGIQAFNAFNHPNFGNPDGGFGDPGFGQISSMTGVPTSPYGNFLGFDSSPRVVQLSGKIVF